MTNDVCTEMDTMVAADDERILVKDVMEDLAVNGDTENGVSQHTRHALSVFRFVDLVNTALSERNITRVALAALMGKKSPATISHILDTKKSNPRLSTMVDIANALGYDLVIDLRRRDGAQE